MSELSGARETLMVSRPGRGLLQLTLARPERGNALNPAMLRELMEELSAASDDPSIRLITLKGAGKHFCGGADIGGKKASPDDAKPTPRLTDLLLAWDHCPKPTVAFVHGACIGAALALASCCDVVVASPDAFFSMPEVRLGMTPSLMPFFVRAIGLRAFRRYGLSGERFDARTAHLYGLVSEMAPQTDWPGTESALLDSFLAAGPRTLAEIKRESFRYADFAITAETIEGARLPENAEAAEGKASFKEKRKPNWWIAPPGAHG